MNPPPSESESATNVPDERFERNLRRCDNAAEAFRIMDGLRHAGFVAYLAGGCVRDALLGNLPKDYDIATDATPESVRKVFGKSNTLAFGASFGVIGVLSPRDSNDSRLPRRLPTEVATFRSDGDYSDGQRPDCVHFGNARQDALRRDFTINGLFYDPVTRSLIDYVGGQQDLKDGLLRTIGSAINRFAEDKLRMLRAVRFATTLEFRIDPETNDAILQHRREIAVVSGERIGAEMRRVMTSPHAVNGLAVLRRTGLADHIMPGLSEVHFDRLTHLLHHLPDRSFAAAMACVAIESDDAAGFCQQTARDWRLSTEEVRQTTAAIKKHATLMNATDRSWASVQPVVIDRDFQIILSVATAVSCADHGDSAGLEKVRLAAQWPAEQLDPPPWLTGDDLRKHGIPPGPAYRMILDAIRCEQLNGEIDSVDQAWEIVKLLQRAAE